MLKYFSIPITYKNGIYHLKELPAGTKPSFDFSFDDEYGGNISYFAPCVTQIEKRNEMQLFGFPLSYGCISKVAENYI